jgi:hypothetical protein
VSNRLTKDFKKIGAEDIPDVEPGDQCSYPVTCEFSFLQFARRSVAADHTTNLPGIRSTILAALAQLGVTSITAIPDDFELTDRQHHAPRS